jgi:hypothetical protein
MVVQLKPGVLKREIAGLPFDRRFNETPLLAIR